MRLLPNRHVRKGAPPAPLMLDGFEFHQRLDGYAATPLLELSALADELGIHRLWAKDETMRLGLPSFKILGASWAAYRVVQQRYGHTLAPEMSLREVRQALAPEEHVWLLAATDGNHGRAVARMARLMDVGCRIFVPRGTASARIAAIRSEGAEVEVVDGTYDDAVAEAASRADDQHLIVADISYPGFEEVPRWVVDGYATIFLEVAEQLRAQGVARPDVIVVQMGCGSLASAAVRYAYIEQPACRVIGVEPMGAACVAEAIDAGEVVSLAGGQHSIMAGLNCGTASVAALSDLLYGLEFCLAIPDSAAADAMQRLASCGVVAGETGAAGLAGLLALARINTADAILDRDSSVLVLITEGNTDPAAYQAIMDSPAAAPASG